MQFPDLEAISLQLSDAEDEEQQMILSNLLSMALLKSFPGIHEISRCPLSLGHGVVKVALFLFLEKYGTYTELNEEVGRAVLFPNGEGPFLSGRIPVLNAEDPKLNPWQPVLFER